MSSHVGCVILTLRCLLVSKSAPRAALDPFDDPFSEQPLRAEQQYDQCKDKGEPCLGIATQQRLAPVNLEQLFQNADHQPADDGPGDRLKPAEHQHRQRLVRNHFKRKADARTRAPCNTCDQSDDPGDEPDQHPYRLQADTHPRKAPPDGHRPTPGSHGPSACS